MPVVTNTIKYPDGTAAAGSVTIDLVGTNGRPLTDGAFVTAGDYAIEASSSPALNTSGVWTATLVANTLINPAGTRWRVQESVNGRITTYYLNVPNGAGPYFVEDILDEAPATIASSALTAHEIDPDAHNNASSGTLWLPPHKLVAVSGSPNLSDDNDVPLWMMDSAAVETLSTSLVVGSVAGIPPRWATFSIDLYWTVLTSFAGTNVQWRCEGKTMTGNGADQSAGWTYWTAGNTTVAPAAARITKVSTVQASVTVPAVGTELLIRIYRRGDQVADDVNIDAGVRGLMLTQVT